MRNKKLLAYLHAGLGASLYEFLGEKEKMDWEIDRSQDLWEALSARERAFIRLHNDGGPYRTVIDVLRHDLVLMERLLGDLEKKI